MTATRLRFRTGEVRTFPALFNGSVVKSRAWEYSSGCCCDRVLMLPVDTMLLMAVASAGAVPVDVVDAPSGYTFPLTDTTTLSWFSATRLDEDEPRDRISDICCWSSIEFTAWWLMLCTFQWPESCIVGGMPLSCLASVTIWRWNSECCGGLFSYRRCPLWYTSHWVWCLIYLHPSADAMTFVPP